ncbi:MAG: hypothetical protein L0Y48_01695 [Fusobacteria bacterium]|nr:hypothetical protein [Fusobacteriota bacterium]
MDKDKKKSNMALVALGSFFMLLPIAFMLVTGIIKSVQSGILRMDFLTPAEFFPVVFVGSFMLFIAGRRVGRFTVLLRTLTMIVVISLIASQGAAVFTGLASGAIEAEGWPIVLVIGLLITYMAATIVQGITGIIMLIKMRNE